jgi:hypothetical protein
MVPGHPFELDAARPHGHQGQPPNGFAWTSHSLPKGATTAAYVIGVNMQKIKFFGGWATESSVLLDYIDPTVAPTTTDWYFFGWLTPWGRQPRTNHQTAT